MRAAVFPGPEICEIVERQPLVPAEGQVVVRVEACGICGTDAHIYRGQFPARFPVVAGHEFAGVVEETGPAVASLRVGDHAAVDPNIHCGACRPCRRGLPHLCRGLAAIGVTQDGGFATHCLVPARQVYKVPRRMPLAVAAMAEPVACCVHGIERAGVRAGDVVVLIGAGTIGLILLQLALLHGAAVAVVSEPSPEKRAAAEQLGASRVVDPRAESLSAIVGEATEGSGADAVIECVGSRETAQQAVELAGEGGRVLLFGVAPQAATIAVSPYEVYRKEITFTGSFTNPFTHGRALALLSSGRLKVEDLISHRLSLEEVPHGIELLESRRATKVMIEPQQSH
jgi:2-desacetyl-2-hydroxyethyl bacteriochlorophyllide A dehydrogenase